MAWGFAPSPTSPAFDDQGTISPDGRSLAFVSSRSGQADIWILELATGALRNLTHDPGGDFRPTWSPDGQWIVFSSDRDSKKPKVQFTTVHSTEIYVVRADGSGLRRVTRQDAFAGSPTWSADGGRLVYYEASTDRSIRSRPRQLRNTQIVAIDLSTNERQALTTGAGEKWSPRWTADGRISYQRRPEVGGFVSVPGARGDMQSPAGRPTAAHGVPPQRRQRLAPLRDWPSRDLHSGWCGGVFPSCSPAGDRFVENDQTAGILHNSILVMSLTVEAFGPPHRSKRARSRRQSPRGSDPHSDSAVSFRRSLGIDRGYRDARRRHRRTVLTNGSGLRTPSWSPTDRLVYRAAGDNRTVFPSSTSRCAR